MRKLKHHRTYEVALDKAGLGPVAGVDEAGRGSCAGPISIAACILPVEPIKDLAALTDSKKLSAKTRAELFPLIQKHARAWSIVHIDAGEIDSWGIQHANISGMRRAVAQLEIQPHYILTDAMKVPGFATPSLPMIGGDAIVRCIAAASVLAKHSRDEIMDEYHEKYPSYGFNGHKGYGTKIHMDAVRLYGASPVHRYSYANVAAAHDEYLHARH
ncbi:ribonuclease HII [Corynebacterium felinum]|uniref:Ribonuclease HII n=1 Tax=Corynebacterium felinum TaxID=131318 RepID=A0ABU2BDH4_9CORY|nr:ribonuclease HII [Corynebacterium felinum]MDF5819848.1 ribonuclease HII [Corynebacterium felinum]MDR7356009.1 ribonuclease HII [Corynebacterium felinum]WJY95344.1 Ribonuclease HII [Corynebacterium felinum]